MKFIKFTEHNEWEGETWMFYLQLDENENEIKKLKNLIKKREDYEIQDKIFDEKEVNILVDNSQSGYLAFHNKVIGKFNCNNIILSKNDDNLYKGGIRDLFKRKGNDNS